MTPRSIHSGPPAIQPQKRTASCPRLGTAHSHRGWWCIEASSAPASPPRASRTLMEKTPEPTRSVGSAAATEEGLKPKWPQSADPKPR
jgi:hypothetical protein